MNKLLVKILILVVIIAALVLYLKFYKSSTPQNIPSEPAKAQQTAKKEDVMANYRQQREQAAARTERTQPKPAQQDDLNISELEAERLYRVAETQFKFGQKIGSSYKQVVDTCREIISSYPDSEYATKARELLRKVPEKHRQMWNVTNEELGL